MNLANCSKCGKVYSPVSQDRTLCPACVKEEQDNFLKVFHFLASQPSATAQEIAQGTGVELTEIYRYVRENRLRLVKTDTGLRCETCGVPISQGKMCDNCRQKLSAQFKNDVDKFKQDRLKILPKAPELRDPKYLKKYRDKDGR
jgi:flagellar operon protein (TIGR03826 family)